MCLQVVPASAGAHDGIDGAFSVLGFDEPGQPDVGYIENQIGAQYLEKGSRGARL